jgi:hypothetical protein
MRKSLKFQAPAALVRTVHDWFRELARRFLFQTIHDVELMLDRGRQGPEASPSAAVIGSQSVKAPHAETRGYDTGKKIVGGKRRSAGDPRRDPQTLAVGETSFRRRRLRSA